MILRVNVLIVIGLEVINKMKALVLAGGYPQIALIEELKSRNIKVILADWNECPVARKYADIFYQVSTLDVDAITRVALEECVDFIITVCTDQALLTVAQVSEKLGLPCYIDWKTARNVTNKAYMKKIFIDYDIPTAKYISLTKLEAGKLANMKFPLIVKPVDCNSSKGVKKVQTYEELKSAFADALAMSRTNRVIVEEFIEGLELSADIYVEDGTAKLLSLSNSYKINESDKFVIFRAVYPPVANADIEKKVEAIAQKIADAFQLKNTPMLIQLLSDGQNISVVEFSARTGGGVKYLLIKHICGFDVIKAVVDLTLGLKPHVVLGEPDAKYLINDFIYCNPGRFSHLEGFEKLKKEGVLEDYYLFKWKNADFTSVLNSGDRVAGYTILANSIGELIQKHELARTSVYVIDEEGKDMTRHDLLTRLQIDEGKIC